QAAQIATAEPAGLFLRLLSAAVASGYAHVADEHGNEPREPRRWGWRPEEYYTGDGTAIRHKPQGTRAGWLADGGLYLEPDASFADAPRSARDQNESFAITAQTLRRRLKEKGLLATTDAARGKLTVRKTLQGARRDVLHIAWAGAPSAPKSGPTGPEGEADAGDGPEKWAGSRAGNGEANSKPAHMTAATGTSGHAPATAGPGMGRLGRSAPGEEGTAGADQSEQQADGWGDWQ